jgi:hypothetical protein
MANDFFMMSSIFEYNTAHENFGALFIQYSESAEITSCNFSYNFAQGSCGAMSISEADSLLITHSQFFYNFADIGGAVCVGDFSANLSFYDINCQDNVASIYGGVMLVFNAINVFLETSSFIINTVLNGDGSAIYISKSSVFFTSCIFSGNSAPRGGGTVF